jgi:hypothetical protein
MKSSICFETISTQQEESICGGAVGGGVGLISSLGQSSFLAPWNGFGYRNLGSALIGGAVGAAGGAILGGPVGASLSSPKK